MSIIIFAKWININMSDTFTNAYVYHYLRNFITFEQGLTFLTWFEVFFYVVVLILITQSLYLNYKHKKQQITYKNLNYSKIRFLSTKQVIFCIGSLLIVYFILSVVKDSVNDNVFRNSYQKDLERIVNLIKDNPEYYSRNKKDNWVEVKNVFTNDVFFVNYMKLKHDYDFVNKNIDTVIDEYPYKFKFSDKHKKFIFNEVQLYQDAIDEQLHSSIKIKSKVEASETK